MQSNDKIIRGTGETAELRFVLVDATATANEIADKHGARAFTRIMLGEAMVSSLMLASRLKGHGTMQTLFRFSGEISLVRADATPLGLVRAMIPRDEVQKTGEFEPLLLPRLISVRKLDEKGASLSEGIVEMNELKIGAATAFYLQQSEQVAAFVDIQSQIGADGKLDYCIGCMVEGFPKVDTQTLETISRQMQELPPFGAFFRPDEGFSLSGLFAAVAGDIKYQIHAEMPVAHFCPCSPEGVMKALSGLGREELQDIIDKNEETELFCDFCRNRYVAGVEDIRGILENLQDEGF